MAYCWLFSFYMPPSTDCFTFFAQCTGVGLPSLNASSDWIFVGKWIGRVVDLLWNIAYILNAMNSLRWRHNGRDDVSDHQPHDCLLNVYSGADQRKLQSSASLVFVRGIHRGPVNSPHKGPVTRKVFPFDDVIMYMASLCHTDWVIRLAQ